jgi:hypothetical protein
MPFRLRSLFVMALAAPAQAAGGAEQPPAFRCQGTDAQAVLSGVSAEGEFRIEGRGPVRLTDLRLAPDGEAAKRGASFLSSLAGSAVRVREVGPPDRWGRASTEIELAGAPPIDLGELLVSEGLAVVDPGQRDLLCRPGLLAAEGAARRNRVGLWREGTWPVQATATEALAGRAGAFAIVEGRVVSVGERRERTYLNFGRDWSRDFSVTIPRRIWEGLKARGVTAASLTRRVVRVRGILGVRRAPTLDLTVPDMLEVVDESPGRTGGK